MFSIREARVEDLQAMLDIYNEAVRNQTATFDIVEHTLDQRMVWFSNHGRKYPLIAAVCDGEIAGYCSLSPYHEKEAYDKTCEISIYINKEHRGKGIGKGLMNEILDRAKQLNYHTIIAVITAGNESSVKIHEKFGFQFIGCLKEVGYKFDMWQDVLFYQKML